MGLKETKWKWGFVLLTKLYNPSKTPANLHPRFESPWHLLPFVSSKGWTISVLERATHAAVLVAVAGFFPVRASAQLAGELEVERKEGATTSRLELLNGGFYTFRAERTQTGGVHTDRLGVRLPGSLLSLVGYVSFFLEDRPEEFAYGTNFELGSGLIAVGGSVERDEDAFTGGYLKLRSADFEFGLGGGRTARDWIGHGALYAKGSGFSVAMGAVAGPGRNFQHLAGTWHPATRGAGPGAMFASERRNGNDWFVEALFTDRANFNYFASWGRYGLDQFPHEKTFEAVGDPMRYFRPPIMNQERTTGMGIVGGRYRVREGVGETTLEARVFPVRIFRRMAGEPAATDAGPEQQRYVRDRVLTSLMVGAFHDIGSGSATALAQLGLLPVLVYAEADLRGGDPYLLIQYRAGIPF